MRVTFVLPPANLSGGVRVVSIYARLLTRLGHVVKVISTRPLPLPLPKKLRRLMKTGRWDNGISRASHLHENNLDFEHITTEHFGPVTDLDVPDADVIIATWWETAEWISRLRLEAGVKVYFIQHHEIFSYLPVERCRATYMLPMHKIVVANWLREVMESEYHDYEVEVISNAVDRSQFFAPFRLKQKRPTAGFLFSQAPFKGLDTTLAALKLVRREFPDLRLLSFGDESPGKKLPTGTEFFLNPPQNMIRNIYEQCDIWVTASRSEGFNLPAMEAMACRTPVVSTKAGWPQESIQTSINGMIVEVDDIESLANSASHVLSLDNDKWVEMSNAAYHTVSESSWETSAKHFEAALFKAVGRTRNSS